MASLINASIDLDKIPKDKIKRFDRKDGSKGASIPITIWVNDEQDKYGNDVSIQVAQTKEERDSKENKVYIGNGLVYKADKPNPPNESSPVNDMDSIDDDLPFSWLIILIPTASILSHFLPF